METIRSRDGSETTYDGGMADEEFSAMLEASLDEGIGREGQMISGEIIRREGDEFIIDVGLKSEGRVAVREFMNSDGELSVDKGASVKVFLERCEGYNGEAQLSREKAKREEVWEDVESLFEQKEVVHGRIQGKVKGGYIVDVQSLSAFLPGSQVDIRPIRDIAILQNEDQPFEILKMDRRRGNIVVSRRMVIERQREGARNALLETLHEEMILEGVIKNITDYGAFVDLGGLDGLLHVTDMSWMRVRHPSEVVSVGDSVTVKVIKFNPETQRISLGVKQLQTDPWEGVGAKYPVGARFRGPITNITDYGAFVELEPGVEGLVHVSEMSWTRKNLHPSKMIDVGQEMEVMILDVDAERRRISLGFKQCLENPWQTFVENNSVGSTIVGEIRNITEFGLFIGLDGDIDGLVHLSDISWDSAQNGEVLKEFQKGQTVEAVVLAVDPEKERISLGLKQAQPDLWSNWVKANPKGTKVSGVVTTVTDDGAVIQFKEKVEGWLRRADFSKDPKEVVTAEKEVAVLITKVDRQNRKIEVSLKALESEEERKMIREYTKSDDMKVSSGNLGDLLGQALEEQKINQM